ncbi:hypothetical protein [Sphingobacterium sp.]|jgi:hypothetical protein|uniref:hypothetical protein n=1 Tax=Sphingobacterium sp. TaxID=341027 RepID=UPI00289EA4CA|nr:hypothetical protein [Sphingobacterium sp.]
MKVLILISSFLFLLGQNQKEVYVLKDGEGDVAIEYNKLDKDVNIVISDRVIANKQDQKAIKMYIASFFIADNVGIQQDFKKLFQVSMSDFAKHHKREICSVIYYLEHIEHGNLPELYGLESYKLFEISELEPEISRTEKCLDKGGILKIIYEIEEDSTSLKMPQRIK